MGDGRVGTLRINLAWGSVQAGPDAGYDWSHYDDVIGGAAKNGIRVLATVYSSPTWAEPSPEYPPLGDRLPGFQAFVRAAVERYGSGGTYWKENPGTPKLPVVDWQLWNEPNSALFWKPSPNAADYVDLLRAFRTSVKGSDPNARVILGGLFPTPAGEATARYLPQLYRDGGGRLFDEMAVHAYAGGPEKALETVSGARAIMDRFGDRERPIWITEVGWASGGDPSGLTVGPARQAEYLRQTFEMAAEDRERLRIAGVIWYSLNDVPGSVWPAHCGLFELGGQPKPSWDAFVALTGGTS
jgi:hypothetical protein